MMTDADRKQFDKDLKNSAESIDWVYWFGELTERLIRSEDLLRQATRDIPISERKTLNASIRSHLIDVAD